MYTEEENEEIVKISNLITDSINDEYGDGELDSDLLCAGIVVSVLQLETILPGATQRIASVLMTSVAKNQQ